jgi:hypothetical protein
VVVDYVTLGVDRPSDVSLVEAAIENDSIQKELFQSISR